MMAERLRTISVSECDSEIGISDVFSSSIHSEPSLMNTSQISTSSQDSQRGFLSKSPHNLPSKRVSLIASESFALSLIGMRHFRSAHHHVVFRS